MKKQTYYLAKQASKLHPKPVEILPLSHMYHKVQQHNLAIWIEKWLTGTSGNTLRKIQKNPRDISSYHGLPRSIQSFVARAQTGHIITEEYLHRFNLTDSPICKVCHLEPETLEHITERGGSVVTHETRIREVPGSNPGADQPN